MNSNEIYAFTLTLMAGLATVAGSLIAFFAKKTNTRLLAGSLGFSAGVMIYVSMAELFIKSKEYLTSSLGVIHGNAAAAAAFFAGIIIIGMIDYFVPSAESDIGSLNSPQRSKKLRKMGILMAAAMAVHNLPEGLVTFTSSLRDVRVGAMIALAIAIHNIPEGITTSLPIFFATGSRKRAFSISFFSGITEPLGAVLGYTIMKPYLSDELLGVLFGIISGIMIFISIEELLPMAREYEKSKFTILSVIAGMLIMAVSLIVI
ncbi:MAG: zinc transporter ZupT [Clostridia bacterium]|nr:zinc transporter ZupT [Clostridia bacterium]